MGFVYALYNPSFKTKKLDAFTFFPIKIGMTTSDPWTRAKELHTTGVLSPFEVLWYDEVPYPKWFEKELHKELDYLRIEKIESSFT